MILNLLLLLTLACKSEDKLVGNYLPTGPQTYFFDSVNGSDNNDGLTKANAFKSLDKLDNITLKAGDEILLANGSKFNGIIPVRGFFGSEEKGLLISNYQSSGNSSQEKPHIDGRSYVSPIFIQNSSNITISNISISADGGGSANMNDTYPSGMRCGVLVYISSDRDFSNINIDNVDISNVFYENPGFLRDAGEVATPNGTQSYGWGIRFLNESSSGTLKNIAVSNCNLENISHSGIRFITRNQLLFEDIKLYNNRLYKTGGPGIVFQRARKAHVMGNEISYSGSPDDDRKWGRGSGLWTWGSSEILIEKNSFSYANGPADSAGCHIDFNCSDVIVQHNLSLANAGGFIEILGNNYNCSYRYNVSINDGYRVKGEGNNFQEGKTFWFSGYVGHGNTRNGPFNSYIYNNTIFTNASILSKIAVDKASQGAMVVNNIFHIEGDSKLVLGDQYKPDDGGIGVIDNVTFENNLFLKGDFWPSGVLIQPTDFQIGDAQFQNKGGLEIKDYTPTNIELVRNKGIKVQKINQDSKGLYIGLDVEADILGNPINGLPDMGAIELN